jgi:hypothetical protein
MFYPNTTISIMRGTAESAYGSEIPSTEPLYAGITASIIDAGVSFRSGFEGRSYEVHNITGRVDPSTDVVQGDRVMDERDDKVYEVLAVTSVNTFVANTKRLTLRELAD